VQGRPDPVTSTETSIDFYQRLDAPAKELIIYDGLLHELHNDKGRTRVLEDYLAWIEKGVLPVNGNRVSETSRTHFP